MTCPDMAATSRIASSPVPQAASPEPRGASHATALPTAATTITPPPSSPDARGAAPEGLLEGPSDESTWTSLPSPPLVPPRVPQATADPGPQPNEGMALGVAHTRTRRIRKAHVLHLNACDCGVTITDAEIQQGKTVMKCRVLGCETVWVRSLYSLLDYTCSLMNLHVFLTRFSSRSCRVSQFHQVCMGYEFSPKQWSCESCRAGSSRRRCA